MAIKLLMANMSSIAGVIACVVQSMRNQTLQSCLDLLIHLRMKLILSKGKDYLLSVSEIFSISGEAPR